MIDRVADAIVREYDRQASQGAKTGFAAINVNPQLVARAAIEAMRTPTAAMGVAAYPAWDAFGEDATMGPEEALAIWRAMIAAALEQP